MMDAWIVGIVFAAFMVVCFVLVVILLWETSARQPAQSLAETIEARAITEKFADDLAAHAKGNGHDKHESLRVVDGGVA